MILEMKFQKKPYIYKTIEYFLQNNKKYLEKLKKYDIIIVVPLSWKRRLQRGYNQSQLIAEIISSILQIKIESRILYKTKNIVPQSTLNKKERKENIKGAFKIKNIENINKILFNNNVSATFFIDGNIKDDDINILKGGPQNRRKFLDIMISQLRPNYMHLLTLYKQTLEQRNNYLKQIKFENKPENMLDIWDEKLVDYGIKIYEYRNEFIEKIQKKIKNIHFNITQEKENIEIKYFSDASTRQNFINELKSKRKLDIIKGFTTKGVHHDDFLIYLNDKQVNYY